ncbi:MAG: hypothetical protein HYU73_29260 [Betaproteobacteria bacterium]|nr:hypothetical protein [Betaproteobacteria bacterium]
MVVFTIGVNHFDPLGRENLLARLRALASCHSNAPAFVAVEYDQHNFHLIAGQRDHFRRLIKTKSSDDLEIADFNAFANSLAYDGDSHNEVFPGVPVLWLEQLSESDSKEYATARLNLLVGHSGGELLRPGALNKVSQAINTQTEGPRINDRDRNFCTRILDRIREVNGYWAIVITGKAHADKSVRGSMRHLLEAAGVNCVDG